jgi:hypothetical protein
MMRFSEHHMEEEDQLHLILPGSSFCCQNLQMGDLCVFLFLKTCVYFNKIILLYY